jgi:L-asparaginase
MGESVVNNDKKILILTTGGTILSVYDPERNSIVPGLSGNDLLKPIIRNLPEVKLEVQEFVQKPGPHLTPEIALDIAGQLQRMEKEYDGIVVIQGTDTIEEFAYMVSLITSSEKPVVFTGAMKSNNEFYADGLGNITASIEVVCSPEAWGRGVMVVFNENIFAPRDIIKMHTSSIDSFQAPDTGPMGRVAHGKVYFYHEKKQAQALKKQIEPNVELLKVSIGSHPFLLDKCLDEGIKGIVIEGLGAGNVPPDWVQSIENAINKNIPIIITSRCPQGSVSPMYDYMGGGKSLERLGVIFAGRLTGPKAKIKLMLLLGQSPRLDVEDIAAAFSEQNTLLKMGEQ